MAHARITKHWKQKFNPEGPFIFTRSLMLEDGRVAVGDDVPDYLSSNKHRMLMWWKANRIALKNWNYPLGVPMTKKEIEARDKAEAPLYEKLGGAWFLFQDGTKAHGKKQLEAKLATLV